MKVYLDSITIIENNTESELNIVLRLDPGKELSEAFWQKFTESVAHNTSISRLKCTNFNQRGISAK
jgi:hypothetical protein